MEFISIEGVFINAKPAGLAFVFHDSIAINVNAYNYQNWTRVDEGDPKFPSKLRGFDLVPTTIGINFKLSKNLAFAFSIIQIDKWKFNSLDYKTYTVDRPPTPPWTGIASFKIDIDNNNWLIGPSFAYRLSKYFAIGISLFVHHYQGQFSAVYEDQDPVIVHMQNNVNSIGFAPIIGVKWNVINGFKIGLKYGFETINIEGTKFC